MHFVTVITVSSLLLMHVISTVCFGDEVCQGDRSVFAVYTPETHDLNCKNIPLK